MPPKEAEVEDSLVGEVGAQGPHKGLLQGENGRVQVNQRNNMGAKRQQCSGSQTMLLVRKMQGKGVEIEGAGVQEEEAEVEGVGFDMLDL